MTAKDPSYAHTRFHSADSPPSVPTGKQNDPNPTPGNKRGVGMPDGTVADFGRWNGADTPAMPLPVKGAGKQTRRSSDGEYH